MEKGSMEANSWRTGINYDSRQKLVKRIKDVLQRHVPSTGEQGYMQDLTKVARRFEEKIYDSASDQQDYLRRISLKMLALETKAQTAPTNPPPRLILGARSGGEAQGPIDKSSWRTDLTHGSRQKIVKRITDTLQRHVTPGEQSDMQDLAKLAWRFEEKIYNSASDQQDYLRRISLKMLALEEKTHKTTTNPPPGLVRGAPSGIQAQFPMNESTWRTDLVHDARQNIVKRITDTLQRHVPPAREERDMQDLVKTAWRFEEKIYNAASDQQDYLRRISLKMLALESKAQTASTTMRGITATLGLSASVGLSPL